MAKRLDEGERQPPKRYWAPSNEFGFRHTLQGANPQLHELIGRLGTLYSKPEFDAIVCDTSELAVEIVMMDGSSRLEGPVSRLAWNHRVKMAKKDVTKGTNRTGVYSVMPVVFDHLAEVGGNPANGERQRLALRPRVGQLVVTDMIREHEVCERGMYKRRLTNEVNLTGFTPQLVIAASFSDAAVVAKASEEEVFHYVEEHDGIEVDLNPIQFIKHTTDLMLPKR